jgi:hypothetical protein
MSNGLHTFAAVMGLITDLLLNAAAPFTAFFVFLGLGDFPEEEPFADWFNNDGFDESVYEDPSKQLHLNKLKQFKRDFNLSYRTAISIQEAKEPVTPMSVFVAVHNAMIKIDKLRLIIQNDIYLVSNLHKPSGVTYIVARANWIDNKGKKVRKFAKNLGSDQKILVDGKIPEWRKEEARKELFSMMKAQFELEYP